MHDHNENYQRYLRERRAENKNFEMKSFVPGGPSHFYDYSEDIEECKGPPGGLVFEEKRPPSPEKIDSRRFGVIGPCNLSPTGSVERKSVEDEVVIVDTPDHYKSGPIDDLFPHRVRPKKTLQEEKKSFEDLAASHEALTGKKLSLRFHHSPAKGEKKEEGKKE